MITPAQRKVLVFIARFIEEKGLSPSYDEIVAGVGLRSKGSVHRSTTCLVARGMLGHLPGHSRTFKLTELGKEWAALGPVSFETPKRRESRAEQARRIIERAGRSSFIHWYELTHLGRNEIGCWEFSDTNLAQDAETIIVGHCGCATVDDLDNPGAWQAKWDELLKGYESWVLQSSGLAA